MHFALSPEQNESLVRWPPEDFVFDGSIYDGMPEDSDCHEPGLHLKSLYPEITHWTDEQCYLAWERYAEDTSWGDQPLPRQRDRFFIAYLYASQVLDFNHRGLDELDELWVAIGR